jgi:hypothetical protein
MKTIRSVTSGGTWHDVRAYSDTTKPLVIGSLINDNGYGVIHVVSGGMVCSRMKLKDVRPLLAALLALDVDWKAPLDTLAARADVAAKVRGAIAAIGGALHSDRA